MEPSPSLRRSSSLGSRKSSKSSSEALVPATQPDPIILRKGSSDKVKNSHVKGASLSFVDDSEDFSYRQSVDPTSEPHKEMAAPTLTPIKTRPNRTLKRKISDVTLGDLLKDRCLKTGERLKFHDEEGIVTKDAWIEYRDEKYPTLEEFASAVSANTKFPAPENAWKEVIARAVPIVFIAENYLATLPKISPSEPPTSKKKTKKEKTSPPSDSKKHKDKKAKKQKREKEEEKAFEEDTERSETAAAITAPPSALRKRKSSLPGVRPQDLHANASADLLEFARKQTAEKRNHTASATQSTSSLSSIPFGVSASQPELRTSARRKSSSIDRENHRNIREKVIVSEEEKAAEVAVAEELFASISPSPVLESPDRPPVASKKALSKSPALLHKKQSLEKTNGNHNNNGNSSKNASPATKHGAASAATASPASEDTLASHERNLAAMDQLIRNRISPPSFVSKPSDDLMAESNHNSRKKVVPPRKEVSSEEEDGGNAFFTPSSAKMPQSASASPKEQLVLLGTGLKSEMLLQMQTLITKMRWGGMVREYDSHVSHLVALVNADRRTQRTLKYLSAVLEGKWIVSFNWVLACLEAGKRLDEREFEVLGDTHAVGAPALSRAAHSKKNFHGLFAKHRFYFHGSFESPSKQELERLVQLGGALVLSEPPSPPRSLAALTAPSNSNQQQSSASSFSGLELVLCDPSKCSDSQLREAHLNTGRHPPLKDYRLIPQDLEAMLQTQYSQTY